MIYLYGLAGIGLIISAIASRQKTKQALITAWKTFIKMLPMLLMIVVLVSVVLYFLPDNVIAQYLSADDLWIGVILATAIGAVSLLPGFVTFPLCGLLLGQGVSYTVLAAFSTSLMMVGIVTFPMEKKYFGTKLAVVRNVVSLFIALVVSLVIGIVYGEVF